MKMDKLSIELAEVRSRLMLGKWATASVDVTSRLRLLARAMDETPSSELYRHVPVAAIAALETFFRSVVVDLVDRGDPYSSRASKLIKEKVSLSDAISWFHGKALTAGEVIARSASFNTVTDINSWLGTLLELEFKTLLESAVDPHSARTGIGNSKLIVNDVDALFARVQDTFRVRHILAHEAALQVEVSRDEAASHLSAVTLLVDGIDAVVWNTANADVPLTQREMNDKAYADFRVAEAELDATLASALVGVEKGTAEWLARNQEVWKQYVEDWINTAYKNQMGSIWPMIAATEHERLIKDRIELLRGWTGGLEGPSEGKIT